MNSGPLVGGLPPVVIAVAPNGGRRTRLNHPGLPVTLPELVRTAAECCEAGAAMIHVHIRDAQERHLLDADIYRDVIHAIRGVVGDRLVVQITSESVGLYAPEAQMAVVQAVRPEAVSLALRELVPDPAHEKDFAAFLQWLRQERVVPQVILYSPEEVLRFAGLRQRGLIPWDSIPVLFVLGSYAGEHASMPADLLPFLGSGMPRFDHWMVCAFGRHEGACVTAAALLGGHVRVGFENNLHQADGRLAPDNATQVQAVARVVQGSGASLADAARLRATWAIF
jgi:3-keto-5-aminohexanoate cleavage enzyme